MSISLKFCKDCAHHLASVSSNTTANYDKCGATATFNLVTGKATYKYCEAMRLAGQECGLEGLLYLQKFPPLPTPEDEAFNALGGSNV